MVVFATRFHKGLLRYACSVIYLTKGSNLLISVGHGVLCEGGVRHVGGPGVPAVHEGRSGTFVPLHPDTIPLSPAKKEQNTLVREPFNWAETS